MKIRPPNFTDAMRALAAVGVLLGHAALDISCLVLAYVVTKILLNSKLKFLVSMK